MKRVLVQMMMAWGVVAMGQVPAELDLESSRTLLLANNPALQQARERLTEQDGVLMDRYKGRLPRFNATGNYSITDDGLLEDFGSMGVDDTSWGASAETALTLYSGGAFGPNYENAELIREALTVEVTTAEQDLLLQLHEAFYGALLARQTIEVAEASIQLLEEQLVLASNRFEAGVGPKFDVLQAEVALANERPALLRARNSLRIQVEQVRRWIGVPFPDDVELVGEWEEVPPTPELDNALETARRNRPEFADLALRQEAGRKDVLVAKREVRPRVEAFAGYGIQNDRFSEDDDYLHGWSTGVRANWPIWNGREAKAKLIQRQSQVSQLELQELDLDLQIAEEVRRNVYNHQVSGEILGTSLKVIAQAEEALRLAQNRFSAGAARQLDVLQQQVELTRARLRHANAQHALHVAQSRLLRSMGKL